jgi:CheY-like chemotaxis protein
MKEHSFASNPFSHKIHNAHNHIHIIITNPHVHFLLREGYSLYIAPAVVPQHNSNLCGSRVSVMPGKDAATNTQPGGGHSSLKKTTLSGAQAIAQSSRTYVKESETLQRILLVEDDVSLANLEADILSARGYAVSIATSGEMAITALHQDIPDLVLLDLDLSGATTGWDVLKVLRSYSSAPVLLTSAESTIRSYIRTQGESRSTLDHLPKPYPLQALLKRIERMLAITPQ